MFLVIDNFDSFVYNLARYVEELDEDVVVYRSNRISLDTVATLKPEGIIISPGPKSPKDSIFLTDLINTFKGRIPILGICLGHQAIGYNFGADIIKANEPVHGMISEVLHDGSGIFFGVKNPLKVTRYHSLIVDRKSLPDCLRVTCETKDGIIMGLRHKTYCIEGVQFHPEAELTECGHQILKNFIDMCKGAAKWK